MERISPAEVAVTEALSNEPIFETTGLSVQALRKSYPYTPQESCKQYGAVLPSTGQTGYYLNNPNITQPEE